MIRISDVAKEAGVSISTVSNVINRKGTTKKETEALVLETIDRLGYIPNRMAQGLKSNRTNVIGIIAEDISSFSSGDIIDGICAYAESHDYTITLCNLRVNRKVAAVQDEDYQQLEHSPGFLDSLQNLVRSLEVSRICGLIYIGTYPRDIPHCLADLKIPVVFTYSYRSEPISYSVNYDDFQGAYLATENLIRHGHTRIGLISGSVNSNPTYKRMLGYQTALMDHQIPFVPEYICTGKWRYEDGYEQCERLLSLPVPPTAIFSMSDLMAYGAMNLCLDHGLRIPEDLSIHGFDNLEFSAYTRPSLATIKLPLHKIGSRSAEILCSLLNEAAPQPSDILIPCTLSEGKSVAAPHQ